MERFWEAKILDSRTFFVIFSKQILEDVLERQKIEKDGNPLEILGRPGGMCEARGGDREGVIRRLGLDLRR